MNCLKTNKNFKLTLLILSNQPSHNSLLISPIHLLH